MRSDPGNVSGKSPSGVLHCPICRSDLPLILREANAAARRLVRQLNLPAHYREDLCQDLLLDLIARLKWFNPSRSSLGAFAGTVMRHHAAKLVRRISRERAIFSMAAREDRLSDLGAAEVRITPLDIERAESFEDIDRQLDLSRALSALHPDHVALCAALLDSTPTEITRTQTQSRASLYRQVKEIRMLMLMQGISLVA